MAGIKRIDPQNYEKPSKFMRMKPGPNYLRLISDGFLYKKIGVKMGGRYVSQIIDDGEEINEALARSKTEPKTQWGWVVFDHRLGEPRVLEVGPTVGDAIAQLMGDSEWHEKDIEVVKTGEGLKTEYTVKFAKDTRPVQKISKAELNYYLKYFKQEAEGALEFKQPGRQRPANVDADGVVAEPVKEINPNGITDKERAALFAMLRERGLAGDDAKKFIYENAGVESTKDLTPELFRTVRGKLELLPVTKGATNAA